MGISSSHPVDGFSQLIHQRQAQDPGHEQTYTKEKIEEGLKVVASHLHAKKLNVSIVTVGGAVNTVLLKTRASTGDVDFFYRTKNSGSSDSQLVHEVVEGGKLAETKLGLGQQWLNNHTVVFIEEGTINDLYAEAIQQKAIVFSAQGLTVYAAPWVYSMMAKLDRAAKPGAKSYDVTDAVDYLDRAIKLRGGQAVKKSELKAWATKYKLTVPTEALIEKVNKAYKAKYGKDGIVSG